MWQMIILDLGVGRASDARVLDRRAAPFPGSPLCLTVPVLDPSDCERVTELVRLRLAQGGGHHDVLDQLRRQGLEKFDTIRVLMGAAGMSHAEAKLLVHNSSVWADRREADEELEDQFWRAAFIMCVISGGHVDEPPEWAAECHDRQTRATTAMSRIAADLHYQDLDTYKQHMAGNQLGHAFAALVGAGQRGRLTHQQWRALAGVADTLCLTEILPEDSPAADDEDYIHAAHLVRRMTTIPW
jgi:hypothetical protein